MFFKKYDKDIFDYIFIFSDHGCILSDDNLSSKNTYHLLNDNRSKIFLHMRKKGEKQSHINSSLRSIMDVYPTISKILNNPDPKNINGISLFNKKPHDFIVIEDSCNFKPYLGIHNDIWRYKEIDYSYYVSLYDGEELISENINELKKIKDQFNEKKIINRISDISCSYKELKKKKDMLEKYSKMYKNYSTIDFSSGNKRSHFIKIYFYKCYARILKILKSNSNFKKYLKKIKIIFLR